LLMRVFKRKQILGANAAKCRFVVVVHDVCPIHAHAIQAILAALEPLVGKTVSAAVVPNWHGSLFDAKLDFAGWVAREFDEILLHGWTHERAAGRGVVSYCTSGSDEFAGLGQDETSSRLRRGQDQLTRLFGHRSAGFVPPAWQRGCIDREALRLHGLQFLFGYMAIEFVDGTRIPVSTITWDVGRFRQLGYVAASVGCALARVRGRSVRCLAAHPVDVSRGYLPRIVRTVDFWIRSGSTPILPSELLSTAHEDSAS
jgi:predicted deacetylase